VPRKPRVCVVALKATSYQWFAKRGIFLVLMISLCFGNGRLAVATERAGVQPLLLSNKQLDRITAGGATLQIDLSAEALGATATTSAVATIQSVNTAILLVQIDSEGAKIPRVRFLGHAPATVFLGAGRATASGATSRDCSASIEASGDFDYLTSVAQRTIAPGIPTTLTCACAALAITLGRN